MRQTTDLPLVTARKPTSRWDVAKLAAAKALSLASNLNLDGIQFLETLRPYENATARRQIR